VQFAGNKTHVRSLLFSDHCAYSNTHSQRKSYLSDCFKWHIATSEDAVRTVNLMTSTLQSSYSDRYVDSLNYSLQAQKEFCSGFIKFQAIWTAEINAAQCLKEMGMLYRHCREGRNGLDKQTKLAQLQTRNVSPCLWADTLINCRGCTPSPPQKTDISFQSWGFRSSVTWPTTRASYTIYISELVYSLCSRILHPSRHLFQSK
jgi:hypothetical protein